MKSFFLSFATPLEISQIISNMKDNSFNTSEFPTKLIKLIKDPLSIILSKLFNEYILSEKFPKVLKIGRVTPRFKKGSRKSTKNYRPITNLNSIAKIFDKLLYNMIIKFFETNNLLNKYQFGFRENMGIEHANPELKLLY